MWELIQDKINDNCYKYSIANNSDILSSVTFFENLKNMEEFRTFFIEILSSHHFPAFYWECRPNNFETLNQNITFAIINSPELEGAKADRSLFKENLNTDCEVISFPNLKGDAQLVVPVFNCNNDTYAHLANFVRQASKNQIHEFFKVLAFKYLGQINKMPIWLSTAGLSVSWLHVRIDSTPKYYRFAPFKNWPQ